MGSQGDPPDGKVMGVMGSWVPGIGKLQPLQPPQKHCPCKKSLESNKLLKKNRNENEGREKVVGTCG